MNFGFTEILIIAVIVVLLFGGKKIPQLARSLGTSLKSFKKGLKDAEESSDNN